MQQHLWKRVYTCSSKLQDTSEIFVYGIHRLLTGSSMLGSVCICTHQGSVKAGVSVCALQCRREYAGKQEYAMITGVKMMLGRAQPRDVPFEPDQGAAL